MELPVNIPILDIETVRGCFLDCRWCTLDKSKPYRFMDVSLFEKIIDEAERCGAGRSRLLLFRSGEPFLHPRIPALLDIIAARKAFRDVTVEFYTNAMLISREQAEAVMESPLKVEIIFSVDGTGDRESFEYMRSGAYWSTLVETVGILSDMRRKSPYRTRKKLSLSTIIPDPSSVPFFVPDEETIRDRFSEAFRPLGVDDFYYRCIHRWTGKTITDGMPARKWNQQGPCYFIKRGGISIMVDGKISPCCADIEGELLVGDLNTESLAQIYHGNRLTEMREMMLKGGRSKITGCDNCDLV